MGIFCKIVTSTIILCARYLLDSGYNLSLVWVSKTDGGVSDLFRT